MSKMDHKAISKLNLRNKFNNKKWTFQLVIFSCPKEKIVYFSVLDDFGQFWPILVSFGQF